MNKEEKKIIVFICVLSMIVAAISVRYYLSNVNTEVTDSENIYIKNGINGKKSIDDEASSDNDKQSEIEVPVFDSNNMHDIFGKKVNEPELNYEFEEGVIEYYKPEEFIPKQYGEGLYADSELEIFQDENNKYADDEKVESHRSKKIIIDTDFASDADDILAIRLALCQQDKGLLDVIGISLSTTYSRSPLAIYALCKYDGYGSIPVAMDTSGKGVQVHTEYVNVMYNFPKNRDDYEQPVAMYRRLLAESDTKVNIITLGFLQNIQNLMNSGPDRYSALTGTELIQQKVDTIYIVGGSDSGRPSFNFYWTGEKVINAAKTVCKGVPCRTVYISTDLSYNTFCGEFYCREDRKEKDIVTKALKSNKQTGGVVAWDVFSMFCAVQDINNTMQTYSLELESGNWYVSDTGATKWVQDGVPERYRIVKKLPGEEYNIYLNSILYEKFKLAQDK